MLCTPMVQGGPLERGNSQMGNTDMVGRISSWPYWEMQTAAEANAHSLRAVLKKRGCELAVACSTNGGMACSIMDICMVCGSYHYYCITKHVRG